MCVRVLGCIRIRKGISGLGRDAGLVRVLGLGRGALGDVWRGCVLEIPRVYSD